jgi:hypothetical protein
MNEQKNRKIGLLPLSIIELAANGDVDAILSVLKHYEGYIKSLSTRKLYDEYGNTHLYIDEGLKRRVETKLLTAIIAFAA